MRSGRPGHLDEAGHPAGHVHAAAVRRGRQHAATSRGLRPAGRCRPLAPLRGDGHLPGALPIVGRPRRCRLAHRCQLRHRVADFMSWRANIHSKGRALLMLFLFSDVSEQDAPTRIRVGSHARHRAAARPGRRGGPDAWGSSRRMASRRARIGRSPRPPARRARSICVTRSWCTRRSRTTARGRASSRNRRCCRPTSTTGRAGDSVSSSAPHGDHWKPVRESERGGTPGGTVRLAATR